MCFSGFCPDCRSIKPWFGELRTSYCPDGKATPADTKANGTFTLDTVEAATDFEAEIVSDAAFLVENPGRVVSKDEILRTVWGETAVTDNALTRTVAQIRRRWKMLRRSPVPRDYPDCGVPVHCQGERGRGRSCCREGSRNGEGASRGCAWRRILGFKEVDCCCCSAGACRCGGGAWLVTAHREKQSRSGLSLKRHFRCAGLLRAASPSSSREEPRVVGSLTSLPHRPRVC